MLLASAADWGASSGRTCFGAPRLRENICVATFFDLELLLLRRQGDVSAGRAVPARTACGVGELVDHLEDGTLDPLHDQLGDAVTPADLRGGDRVAIDQVHQNLA